MKRAIRKYPLPSRTCEIEIPSESRFLYAGRVSGGQLCIWLLVDPELKQRTKLTVRTVADGEEFDDAGLFYMATIQNAGFVWHLFQVSEQALVPIADPDSN